MEAISGFFWNELGKPFHDRAELATSLLASRRVTIIAFLSIELPTLSLICRKAGVACELTID